MSKTILKEFAHRKFPGIKHIVLTLDESMNVVTATSVRMSGIEEDLLFITAQMIARNTEGEVVASGVLQGNGYWNFIASDTRELISATGYKDLYLAQAALVEYLIGGKQYRPWETEGEALDTAYETNPTKFEQLVQQLKQSSSVSPQRAAYFPHD